MVIIKPHTIRIAPVSQAVLTTGILADPATGAASPSIRCLCTPLSPQEAYSQLGATLVNPWSVLLEVSDAVAYSAPNAEILFNGKQFWQKGAAEVRSNGDAADCAVLWMAENQYPLEG